MIIKFITHIQRKKVQILRIWSNNGTEFKNKKLRGCKNNAFFSRLLEFLWAEAISTACFTQNHSLVFGSLRYSKNDHDDLRKMRPKVDIDHDAPQIVSSSEEPIANESTTLVSDNHSDEQVQEDVTDLDGNTFMNPFRTPKFIEARSSLNYQDPSNMHEFHQQHHFTDRWTKNHLIEKVIGDPSKPATTRSRLYTDPKMYMYALTLSTTKPTNIKEAMLDHSWIELMQDELNQFKRLDVWELVARPIDRNLIKSVGRCNNYAALPNIPCSKERKIVGKLLVDHALSYALTATADVLDVYLQQFWNSVKQVPNASETIRFMIVSYQGLVDKVSAFYTKNLAQPWQAMFKVFNYCFTYQTYVHDQTKLNILQICHAVVNKVNVDYKFESIPKRLEEEYHVIKDDTPLVYKDYEKEFFKVEVPMIQPQSVESTQGANRTPRATRTPNPVSDVVQKKKEKRAAGETSSPRPSLKIHVRHKRENLEEDVDKIVEGEDEESYAGKFDDSLFLDEEDFDTRIELGSHKENLEEVDDDDDEKEEKIDDKNDDDDERVDVVLNDVVPNIALNATNDLNDNNLIRIVANTVKKDRESVQADVPAPISQEFDAYAPKIIEELFRIHMQNMVPSYDKMQTTLRDMISNQFRDTEEYAYHLEQLKNYMENQIVWERRSHVIWEKVHDFQLGIESYQLKINLTTPTLIFPGNEAKDSYSIVDKPRFDLIYLNRKEEKRVMDLVEIVKCYDAILERVLKEVKLKIFKIEFLKKAPLLGSLDLNIMKTYEREIIELLRHYEQMRI
nr:hypothetical protein [Tanacetum cinerariifolium]